MTFGLPCRLPRLRNNLATFKIPKHDKRYNEENVTFTLSTTFINDRQLNKGYRFEAIRAGNKTYNFIIDRR